jgi:cytoskeletal protein CcmA (bactofilin family)
VSLRRELVLIAAILTAASMVVTGVALIVVRDLTHFHSEQVGSRGPVNSNVSVSGSKITVVNTVDGDLHACAWLLNQTGTINGDVSVIAGRAELRGTVTGTVHATGGSISVYGTIQGDVELTGGQVTVVEEAVIQGDLIVHGGTVLITARSQIQGQVRGEAARMTIEGEVDGGVDLTAWSLEISPGAVIRGPVRYESRSEAKIDRSASITGPVVRIDPADRLSHGSILFWNAAALPRYLAMLAVGTALVLLLPRLATRLADSARYDLPTVAVTGVGVGLFVPLVLGALALFVVTIPLVLALGAFYLAAAYLSMPVVGLALGRTLLGKTAGDRMRAGNIGAVAIGVTVIAGIRATPVPFVDWGVALVTAVLGLGAVACWVVGGPRRVGTNGRHPVASMGFGSALGGLVAALAILAILVAAIGTIASLATLSQSAIFSWQIPPRRLALFALVLAGSAILLAVVGAALGRSGRRGDATPP